MSNRTKVRAHASAMAVQNVKALEGVVRTQRELLLRWIELFGDYCTTAPSGQLYKDTKETIQ
jgi:hypothetical protein